MKDPIPTDISRLRRHKSHVPRKPLPWIASPVDLKQTQSARISLQNSNVEQSTAVDPKSDSPELIREASRASHASSSASRSPHAVYFKPRHESTAIELFYDLFFVANLTVFTDNNEISDKASMASYLGFFAVLWLTWLQVSLYDVRFATNSLFGRFSKIVALFVMGAYAFAGAMYNTSQTAFNYLGFRLVCYGLIAQRGMLVIQYGVVLWYVRKYGRGAVLPIILTMAVLFAAGITYIGLIFSFPNTGTSHGYIGYYVVGVFEAAGVIAISCAFRSISFQSTNLIERVGLLTLIILGEGVIGVTRAISTTLLNTYTLTQTMVALAFGALIVLHELWILYFDQIEHDRFGTIRQQIWTLLHLPLHMSLILAMQGNSRFLIWKTGWDAYRLALQPAFASSPYLFNSSSAFVDSLRENLTTFDHYFIGHQFSDYYNFNPNLTYIEKLNWNSTSAKIKAMDLYEQIADAAVLFIFDILDVSIPDFENGITNIQQLYEGGLNVFVVTFIYYVVGAGAVLILLGIMFWFGKRRKSRFEWTSLILRIAAGVALIVITGTIAGTANGAYDIVESNWTIPMVLITYALIIICDDILVWLNYLRYKKTKDTGDWDTAPENDEEDVLTIPTPEEEAARTRRPQSES